MKKRSVSKTVVKITEGLADRVVDLVLLGLIFFEEMSPFRGGSLGQKVYRINRRFGNSMGVESLRGAFRNAQKKGWISQDLNITVEGQKRLEAILPKYFDEKKWDGEWYIVDYDIPESKRWLREILRDNLEELSFGRVHKSLWISPYNFLGEIEKIVKRYNLEGYVLLAISNKVGREPSEILAERVWNLEKINDQYKKFIKEIKAKKLNPREAIFRYLSILHQDPQLPRELLPPDWQGKVSYKIYQNLVVKDKLNKLAKIVEAS